MALSFDIMPLIAGALLDERQYWRENAAAGIELLCSELTATLPKQRSSVAVKRDLAERTELLDAALRGEVYARCFACGDFLRHGQGTVHEVTEGEMHASCSAPWRLKNGDRVDCDPESIAWEDEDEAANSGGRPDYLTAGEVSPLYSAEQIAEILARGRAALTSGRRAA